MKTIEPGSEEYDGYAEDDAVEKPVREHEAARQSGVLRCGARRWCRRVLGSHGTLTFHDRNLRRRLVGDT
jgi:hypothetical protein